MGGAIGPFWGLINKNYMVIPPLFNTVFGVHLSLQTSKNVTPNCHSKCHSNPKNRPKSSLPVTKKRSLPAPLITLTNPTYPNYPSTSFAPF